MARTRKPTPPSASDIGKVEEEAPAVEIADEPAEARAEPVDGGIAELKRKLEESNRSFEAERNARVEAERRAQEQSQIASRARGEVDDTNIKLVDNAIETVKTNLQRLQDMYIQARQAGDASQEAKITVDMGMLASDLRQLENGKQSMAEAAKQPKPPIQTTAQDPVEMLARQLTPRSAAWVRAHPEYARNPSLYQKMIAAHNLVQDETEPDSDAYFEAVENVLKIKRAPTQEVDDEVFSDASEGATRQSSSPPSAPVSRNNVSHSGQASPRAIRLTKDQAEIAKMNDMTEKEYWEQLQRARNSGEIRH